MLTGEVKNKVDAIWDSFFTGGMTNPLEVIEQITYLMFIHDLAKTDDRHLKDSRVLGIKYKSMFAGKTNEKLKWSVFCHMGADEMFQTVSQKVFPFIQTLDKTNPDSAYSKYMKNAIFKIPTPAKLVEIVGQMDKLYEIEDKFAGEDIQGDVYEYMLNRLQTSGQNGQFRTPRHIIRMMVELMAPSAKESICDPASGTGGFLVEACEYIRAHHQKALFKDGAGDHFNSDMFTGYDIDQTMLRISAMNMMAHGVQQPHISYRDSLSDDNQESDRYSLVLANPPFAGSINKDLVSHDLLKVVDTKKTELLFLALFLRILRIGGRAAVIVPDGVLFDSKKAFMTIRKALVENHRLEAVISMPSGVFRPYAGVSTAILIFTKTGHGGTDNVWFYDMKADGFSLDDKRQSIKESDIPDILVRYKSLEKEIQRKRTDQSFFVPKSELIAHGYDLSFNKYKETITATEILPTPKKILGQICRLEEQIQKKLTNLGGSI